MFWFLIIVGIAVALNEIQKRNARIKELEYELSELRRQNGPELDVREITLLVQFHDLQIFY